MNSSPALVPPRDASIVPVLRSSSSGSVTR
jgi:hypothetical protein